MERNEILLKEKSTIQVTWYLTLCSDKCFKLWDSKNVFLEVKIIMKLNKKML